MCKLHYVLTHAHYSQKQTWQSVDNCPRNDSILVEQMI